MTIKNRAYTLPGICFHSVNFHEQECAYELGKIQKQKIKVTRTNVFIKNQFLAPKVAQLKEKARMKFAKP